MNIYKYFDAILADNIGSNSFTINDSSPYSADEDLSWHSGIIYTQEEISEYLESLPERNLKHLLDILPEDLIQRIIPALDMIRNHRKWVQYYCDMAGIHERGQLHDMSKFSDEELLPTIKYLSDKVSPALLERRANKGKSNINDHHYAENLHHLEYWADKRDEKGRRIDMPYEYVMELVCDCLGASRSYEKADTYMHTDEEMLQKELEYWIGTLQRNAVRHVSLRTILFITIMFETLAIEGNFRALRKNYSKELYETLEHTPYSIFPKNLEFYFPQRNGISRKHAFNKILHSKHLKTLPR